MARLGLPDTDQTFEVARQFHREIDSIGLARPIAGAAGRARHLTGGARAMCLAPLVTSTKNKPSASYLNP